MKNNSLEYIYYNPTEAGRIKRRLLNLPEDTPESETAKFQTNLGDAAKRWNVTTMAPWGLAGGPSDAMSQKLLQDAWGMRQLAGHINNPLIDVNQLVTCSNENCNNPFAGTGGNIRNSVSRAGSTLPFPKVNDELGRYGDSQVGLYPFNLRLDPKDPLSIQFAHSLFQKESLLGIQKKIFAQNKQYADERAKDKLAMETRAGLHDPERMIDIFAQDNQAPDTERYHYGGGDDDGYGEGGIDHADWPPVPSQIGSLISGQERAASVQNLSWGGSSFGGSGIAASMTRNTDRFAPARVSSSAGGSLGNGSLPAGRSVSGYYMPGNLSASSYTNSKKLNTISSATIKANLARLSGLQVGPSSSATQGVFDSHRRDIRQAEIDLHRPAHESPANLKQVLSGLNTPRNIYSDAEQVGNMSEPSYHMNNEQVGGLFPQSPFANASRSAMKTPTHTRFTPTHTRFRSGSSHDMSVESDQGSATRIRKVIDTARIAVHKVKRDLKHPRTPGDTVVKKKQKVYRTPLKLHDTPEFRLGKASDRDVDIDNVSVTRHPGRVARGRKGRFVKPK